MIRKQIFMVILGLALLSISIPVSAGVPDSLVSYQGELQNTDGTPIPDGFHTVIFSLYTQPDGGVPVWSELQDVTVSGGLFSVLLGRHTPFQNSTFDNDSLFLSTQVAGGTELLPRLRLGTVPYATKSARVDGDVVTQPGSLEIWSPQSNTSLRLQATNEAASIAIDEPGVHITQLVDEDSTVFDQGSDSNNRVMIHKIHMGEKRLTQMIYPDSLVTEQSAVFGLSSAGDELHLSSSGARRNYHYAHVDARNEIDEDCDGLAAKHAVNTKGTGAQSGRVASVSSRTTLDSAGNVCRLDLDGDGVADNLASTDVSASSAGRRLEVRNLGSSGQDGVEVQLDHASRRLEVRNLGSSGQDGVDVTFNSVVHQSGADLDGDGIPDVVVSSSVVPEVASVAIKTKGTGADKDRVVASCSTGTGGSASLVCDHDSDGDNIPESEGYIKTLPLSSSVAIKTKGTAADANRSMSITATTNGFSSAVHRSNYDDDGDGVPEQEISQTLTPVSTNVAIKTKGTAADGNRSAIVCGTTTESSVIRCDHDSDGDGLDDVSVSQSSSSDSAFMALATKIDGTPARLSTNFTVSKQTQGATFGERYDSNGDGVPENEASIRVTPTTSSLAIGTKGTGAKRLMAGGDCDDTDAVFFLDCDDDGDGVMDRSVSSSVDDSASVVSASQGGMSVSMRTRKGWDGTIKGNMRVSNGSVDVVDLDSDGDGFFAGNVGIGVPATTHHIEVAGGAYCDGSNWVNASDANLKENFSEVNGEELLSKIEELTVTEWNYKNEGRQVKHIGPTAQDFQKTFGVGSDGKSISTIDPSGIALAAIKELNKQNQQLKDQNSELQQRLEDLQKKVDKLISRQ